MKVFKYPLQVADQQVVKLPVPYTVLSVKLQYGIPVLYAMVDETKAPSYPVQVFMVGTGHNCLRCEGSKFITSLIMHDGDLVIHVFIDELSKSE